MPAKAPGDSICVGGTPSAAEWAVHFAEHTNANVCTFSAATCSPTETTIEPKGDGTNFETTELETE